MSIKQVKIPYASDDIEDEDGFIALLSDSNNLVIDGKVIYPVTNNHDISKLLLKTIKLYFFTDDYKTHQSKSPKNRSFQRIVEFINQAKDLNVNILKAFESWEVKTYGIKPQSTSCRVINGVVKKLIFSNRFSSKEKRNLELILSAFEPSKDEEIESVSLTAWFVENSPWLRKVMGDQFLLLESPKRIIKSFQATVGTMLIYVLEARKQLEEHPDLTKLYCDIPNSTSGRDKQKRIIRFIGGILSKPENEVRTLANFILTECSLNKHREKIDETILKCSESSDNYQILYDKLLYKNHSDFPFLNPLHFYEKVNETEMLLMSYLCASLAIQPKDVGKLTRRHIAVKKNSRGNVRQVEIDYLKGRAGRKYKPPTLKSSSVIARAALAYINNLPLDQDKLFTSPKMIKNDATSFVNPFYRNKTYNYNHFQAIFSKLLVVNIDIKIRLDIELKQMRASKIFINAMLFLYDSERFDKNSSDGVFGIRNITRKDYESMSKEPLPSYFFKLSHIKNTSVYSRTDMYRSEDLVNQNSHQSNTEKLSYLTDDNKDWVNQVGRITRMVMCDIESKALKPVVDFIDRESVEKRLMTKVVKNTNSEDVRINRYGEAIQKEKDRDQDHILVFENEQTAITMLHYIDEADTYGKKLMDANRDFFEKTLLINVEWMHHCLSQFEPKLVNKSVNEYERLKKLKVLPRLFDNQIRAGISL